MRRDREEVVVDITHDIVRKTGITDWTIEVVLDESGGHAIYASGTGESADKLSDKHDPHGVIREVAEDLVRRHGDAMYRQEMQAQESRRRLMARGALEGVE